MVQDPFAAPAPSAFAPSLFVSRASSSIDFRASASTEGIRIVLPFSTTTCLPPVLITAYAISLSSQTRLPSIEKSIIIGVSLLNGNRSRLPRQGDDLALVFGRFCSIL